MKHWEVRTNREYVFEIDAAWAFLSYFTDID